MKYRFFSNLTLFWDINAKWLCQQEVPETLVLAHFMVATEGEIGNEPLLRFGHASLSQHLLRLMVFLKAEQGESGYRVCIHM